MVQPPAGTVTFLFTDIEGSTKLWQHDPITMNTALGRHHAHLNDSITAHNGYVFQIIGDAFCAAFLTANDALHAALQAQTALMEDIRSERGTIRVRMALHSGKAEVQPGDFTSGEYISGLTLSRTARLLSAGHGGQILLSLATTELLRDHLPQQILLRDLGPHRLKDLVRPEHIFQVLAPDLQADFPPLRSLDTHPHNLPVQLTSFIGREKEMAEIKQAIASHRLVTLTGTGGSGKTRLSLQVGADLLDQFSDGVWLVELAAVTNPDLIPITILSAFKIGDQPGLTSLQTLTNFLQEKNLLLLLDNCEHLIQAAATLATSLLGCAEKIKILATSREALGVSGELNWRVPTLTLPDMQRLPPVEGLSQYEAVRLFIDRATLAQPHFSVTKDNAPAIAQICWRLDGIPLAIELAAVRVKAMSVDHICSRLDDCFQWLTGGSRSALPRQQTLRAAIDWSFNLLSDQEKILFRRLAVFAGGWTLEAAEQICQLEQNDLPVLDLLVHLVDKSLVSMQDSADECRYLLLETTRQYALEKLIGSKENELIRDRHRDWYLKMAERGDKEIWGPNQVPWLNKLDTEMYNLRAALEWSFSTENIKGVQLANALSIYWWRRDHLAEARSWLEKALDFCRDLTDSPFRAKALYNLALLIYFVEENWDADVYPMLEESRRIFKDLGEPYRVDYACVLCELGWRMNITRQDSDTGWAYLLEGVKILRDAGEKSMAAVFLNYCVVIKDGERDLQTALSYAQEGMALAQESGDRFVIALQLLCLGEVNYFLGNFAAAHKYLQDCLDFNLDLGNKVFIFQVLDLIGDNSRAMNEYEKARTCYQDCLFTRQAIGMRDHQEREVFIKLGYTELYQDNDHQALSYINKAIKLNLKSKEGCFIRCLAGFAAVAAFRGEARLASLLYGAVDSRIETNGKTVNTFFDPADLLELERYQALCRSQLGQTVFEATLAEGRALALEQAIELAEQMTVEAMD